MKRAIVQFDASGQAIGRLASQIAMVLRGKNKPDFAPHIDSGDFVEVANLTEAKFTGGKMDKKVYYHYTGFKGGLKTTALALLWKTKPEVVLEKAVYNMLPKNKLRPGMMKRLKVVK